MTDEEKAMQREFRQAVGFSPEQIAAQEREDELMSRPDDDPEKVAHIFEQARKC